MSDKPRTETLHFRLIKPGLRDADKILENAGVLSRYPLQANLGLEGELFVAPESQNPPRWVRFVQNGIQGSIEELKNRSNAAALILRASRRSFVLTFGQGRHLLRPGALVPDFGIRSALNGLKHDSIRALDSMTIEEQTVHTRSQASKASGIEVFDVDVSRDILRALTGTPRQNLGFTSLSGSEAVLKVSVSTRIENLPKLCAQLLRLYSETTYKNHFSWVDNVRRVNDPTLIEQLDAELLKTLQGATLVGLHVSPPDPIDWIGVDGFQFTGMRRARDPEPVLEHYLESVDRAALSVEQVKSDRLNMYCDGERDPRESWPVYSSLVFEVPKSGRRFVLSAGDWFEIEKNFASSVRGSCGKIHVVKTGLAAVRVGRDGALEHEPDYNSRMAKLDKSMALLDRKTAKCANAPSGIEPCDLLTKRLDFIHVKHRKSGASSLSHLFAQSRVSAEALIADATYRKDVRRLLRALNPGFEGRVPVKRPSASRYRIVLAILGGDVQQPATDLPFFSQLNLVRTVESLRSRGFKVGIEGIPLERVK